MKRLFLTLAITLLFLSSASAQMTLSGKVIEKGSGEVLPFATITIAGTSTGVTTNLDGFFSLIDIAQDDLVLEVSYVGYQSAQLAVARDQSGPLIIELTPANAQLNEVIVTADAYKVLRATTGISTATISTRQLSALPSVGETDIFRSLQLLPGVSGTNENSSGLFVRGGTPDQNLVLLDGMTVYKVDHFFGFFSAFNASAVKDVQLFKGAFPARYGGRTSSVVDLTGKIGSFQKFGGGLGVNFLSANGYLELPVSKKVSVLLAGRRSYTDIIQSALFDDIRNNLLGDRTLNAPNIRPEDVLLEEPEFYFYDWNGKVSYRPSDKDMLTLSVYSGQDFLDESRSIDREIPESIVPDGRILFDLDETTDWGNRGISTKWSRQWGPKWYTNVLLAGSEYFSVFDREADLGIYAGDSTLFFGRFPTYEDNSVADLSARIDVEWQRSSSAKTEFGISLTHTEIDYSNIRNDTLVILERNQEAFFGSIYASNEQQIGDDLKLTTGIRFSDYELRAKPIFEPRISLTYQLLPQWKLKAAYGRHYQFVNRIINENISEGSREFWLLADGDLVQISKADHYVLGLSYEIDNWLFDVEGYYKDLSGLSEFSLRFRRGLEIVADELFFTGSGIARGVEVLIQKKQGAYTGWVSYTLGAVRNTFEAFNEGQKFPALHDQLHEFKMVHSYELSDWTLAATFIYGSGKPFSEPEGQYSVELLDGQSLNYIGVGPKNGSRLPAYHRLDLSIHRKFKLGELPTDLGFSIFNLYNRTNIWYKEYDFTQEPPLITDITYLGITPNLSFKIDF